jgi:hypothetical protein
MNTKVWFAVNGHGQPLNDKSTTRLWFFFSKKEAIKYINTRKDKWWKRGAERYVVCTRLSFDLIEDEKVIPPKFNKKKK